MVHALSVGGALALAATACSSAAGTNGGGGAAPTGGSAATTAVTVVNSSLGPVLGDDTGRSLYMLVDGAGKAVPCSGACTQVWPVATAATASAASGITATLAVSGGQLAADGHPLYRFSGDSGSGSVRGEGISSFGGTWYAVGTDGTPVHTGGAGTSSTTPPASGNGY